MSLLAFLHRIVASESLSPQDAEQAMGIILNGDASTPQVAAFLVALRMKGETADEIYGFARAMRRQSVKVDPGLGPGPLVDTCGTGGDGLGTFNISTVSAFVVAGAGVRVAKHGNRSISSRCGSADVLEKLCVSLALSPDEMAAAIREVGIGFLFAPALHPAVKHAQPARLELKMRTVFNLLGPLANPAGASAQLVGAPSRQAAALMASALAKLGCERGFVVHGSDGLDEITTTGSTSVWEVRGGEVQEMALTPEDFGVPRASLDQLAGGTADENARILESILGGEKGARRDIVLVNSAAALSVAGKAADLRAGVRLATDSLDSGAAAAKLDKLRQFRR